MTLKTLRIVVIVLQVTFAIATLFGNPNDMKTSSHLPQEMVQTYYWNYLQSQNSSLRTEWMNHYHPTYPFPKTYSGLIPSLSALFLEIMVGVLLYCLDVVVCMSHEQ